MVAETMTDPAGVATSTVFWSWRRFCNACPGEPRMGSTTTTSLAANACTVISGQEACSDTGCTWMSPTPMLPVDTSPMPCMRVTFSATASPSVPEASSVACAEEGVAPACLGRLIVTCTFTGFSSAASAASASSTIFPTSPLRIPASNARLPFFLGLNFDGITSAVGLSSIFAGSGDAAVAACVATSAAAGAAVGSTLMPMLPVETLSIPSMLVTFAATA
mmetsp:Transcript_64894/g.138983  ORF Transcript_64894/g.138983 Transcript_64894/m.138983 type:complete len:220 (-) Transcript_64894:208-867(-)